MKTSIAKSAQRKKDRSSARQKKSKSTALTMVDNRPESVAQRKLINIIDSTAQREVMPGDEELLQGKFETTQRQGDLEEEELLQGKFETMQRQSLEEEELLQGKFPAGEGLAQLQKETTQADNRTGMPEQLRTGIESLSGMDMSDVRVHKNSSKPAQLNALAYAQGNDIHLASGQEQHLPHEAWHVVQQRQGRVMPTIQMAGEKVNNDVALETEADLMGRKALQAKAGANWNVASLIEGDNTEVGGISVDASPSSKNIIQPRLGFEIEMLALVDIKGRPIPEKVNLGTAGTHNVEMTVDHGPAVAAPTPTPAHASRFGLPGPVHGHGHGPMHFGAYDTTLGTEIGMAYPPLAPLAVAPPPDPRAALQMNNLDWNAWGINTITGIDRNRHRNPDNRAFVHIDNLIRGYRHLYDNWEAAAAQNVLADILVQTAAWTAANPNATTRLWRSGSNQCRTQRFNAARTAIQNLNTDITLHQAMWTANPNPLAGMQRQYRQPIMGGGMGPWGAAHPEFAQGEGMGRDRYASILEIVTPGNAGFEPETIAGRANIIGAMTDAVNLAANIETATNNFTQRVPLDTVTTVNNVANPQIHVGNVNQPNQTTDASIQSTMAIDLAQIASFVKSTTSFLASQRLFELKHHSDPGDMAQQQPRRAKTEFARTPLVAKNIIRNRLSLTGNPTHLRGLFVLICQYLMMGKHFIDNGVAGLDKNIVPLLSRNDLGSVIFAEQVPQIEKQLISTNLANVRAAIVAETGRNGAMAVFNRAADDIAPAGAAPFNLSVNNFINNILSSNPDGITGHLGGFRQFQHGENIDPGGTRGTDYQRVGATGREGAIFEMRNMIPHESFDLPTDRFPRARWVDLATYMANMLAALNACTVL